MDNIAQRLKAYIEAHPFDPGDSDCETVWTSCTKSIRNPTNPIHRTSGMASVSWMTC